LSSLIDNNAAQLAELREYLTEGRMPLNKILEAANELALCFQQYEDHERHGVAEASPYIDRLVREVLVAQMREAARTILHNYPMMKQKVDDIQDVLNTEE